MAAPDDPSKPLIQYSTLTSGSVASGGGNTASNVNIFPPALATMIRGLGVLSRTKTYWVLASVRATGNTLVGAVRSDAFHYPARGSATARLAIDQGTCSATTPIGTSCIPGRGRFDRVGCCELAGQLVCQ